MNHSAHHRTTSQMFLPPSPVGELRMMFLPIKMPHLVHPGLRSFSIQDSHHCRQQHLFAALTPANTTASFFSHHFAYVVAQLIHQGWHFRHKQKHFKRASCKIGRPGKWSLTVGSSEGLGCQDTPPCLQPSRSCWGSRRSRQGGTLLLAWVLRLLTREPISASGDVSAFPTRSCVEAFNSLHAECLGVEGSTNSEILGYPHRFCSLLLTWAFRYSFRGVTLWMVMWPTAKPHRATRAEAIPPRWCRDAEITACHGWHGITLTGSSAPPCRSLTALPQQSREKKQWRNLLGWDKDREIAYQLLSRVKQTQHRGFM